MSSAVAGYTGAFGFDGPPPAYADIALADCFLLLGHEHRGLPSDPLVAHPRPPGRGRVRHLRRPARDARPRSGSDLHLPVRPGTDLALLSAMLHVVERDGLLDDAFIARHTSGWEETLAVAREWSPIRAAAVCGVDPDLIEQAAHRFAGAGARWRCGRWAPTSRPSAR